MSYLGNTLIASSSPTTLTVDFPIYVGTVEPTFPVEGSLYRTFILLTGTTSGTLNRVQHLRNKYRLIARIKYAWRLINIRCVLSHKEYDRNKWKE